MRVNRQIRVPKVRVIDKDGAQVGIIPLQQALTLAESQGLDLVEISPNARPPVCKIIDYGKFRYQQTKKERESKKAQHQVKIKEVKVKPNTDDHDLNTKLKKARDFLEKGNKVRLTCTFRGRENAHPEVGMKIVQRMIEQLSDIATPEDRLNKVGRNMSVTLAPGVKKPKEKKSESESKSEDKESSEGAIQSNGNRKDSA